MTVSGIQTPVLAGLRRGQRALSGPFAWAIPGLAFIAIFALYPLLMFSLGSIFDSDGRLTPIYYQQVFDAKYFASVTQRTIGIAAVVSLLCTTIGYPLAYLLHRAQGRQKIVLISLVVLPYLTSVLVRVFAWSALLGLTGPVNQFLVGIGVFSEPQQLGHSLAGTLIGMVHVLTPIAVLTMWATMARIPEGHEITAGALGASKVRVFFSVFFPLSFPGVIAGLSLVYVLAIGAYVIPVALGPTNGLLFAQVVADQATVALNWGFAGALTVVTVVLALLPLAALRLIGMLRPKSSYYPRRQLIAVRAIYPALEIIPARVWRGLAILAAYLVLAFLVIPEVVIVIFSLGPINSLSLPPSTWTLDGYREFFADPAWTEPMGRSFLYAGADALIAVVFGGLAAYGLARSGPRTFAVGLGILAFPLALPEIIPALGFYVFANKSGIAGSGLAVTVGQAVTAIGLAAIITSTVIQSIDLNLEFASQMSGASRITTLVRIVAPLAFPGLIVGALYSFLNAFDNLVLPLFVSGVNTTLPVKMFFKMQDEISSLPAVVASLLIAMLLLASAIAVLVMSRANARVSVTDVANRA